MMVRKYRSLYSNPEGLPDDGDIFIYSDQGYMTFLFRGWKTYFSPKNEPGPGMTEDDIPEDQRSNGFADLIKCVRSRDHDGLDKDILKGHLSAMHGHLGVISYCTGRKLTFNPATEQLVNNKEADIYLKRQKYREPYIVPEVFNYFNFLPFELILNL